MKENDGKILSLKTAIEGKRINLGKEPRFIPLTKCIFILEGKTYNIHTLGLNDIDYLIIYMAIWKQAGDVCKLTPLIQGYSANDWQQDLINRKSVIEYNEKVKELNTLQTKLDTLLSNECRTQLEIDSIADFIDKL